MDEDVKKEDTFPSNVEHEEVTKEEEKKEGETIGEKSEEIPIQSSKAKEKEGLGGEEKPPKEKKEGLSFIKKPLFWQLTTVILLILFVISLFSAFGNSTGFAVKDIGAQNAHAKVKDYVDAILQGQVIATLSDPVEDASLYKIEVTIQGQTITSYVTKDGRLFFPTVVDLDEFETKEIPPIIADVSPTELEMFEEELEEELEGEVEEGAEEEGEEVVEEIGEGEEPVEGEQEEVVEMPEEEGAEEEEQKE